MNNQLFERRYIEYVLELAESQFSTQAQFAAALWPEKSEGSANTTIIALKKQNSRGKPQNLRMSDAIRMAEVLGREFPSLCFEVWEQVKIAVKSQTAEIPREKKMGKTAETFCVQTEKIDPTNQPKTIDCDHRQ